MEITAPPSPILTNLRTRLNAGEKVKSKEFKNTLKKSPEIPNALLDDVETHLKDKNVDLLTQDIEIARLLGMDKKKKTKEFLNQIEKKYNLQQNDIPADGMDRRRFVRNATLAFMGATLIPPIAAVAARALSPIEQPERTATTASPTKIPESPIEEVSNFNDLIKPLIEEAHRRREEWASKDPDFYNRVDRELNADVINIGLSAWATGQGEALNVLSYNIKTGEIKSVILTRETILPEMVAISKKKDPSHAYAMGFGTPMALYNTGGFDTMRTALQDITGLHPDFQIYIEDMALFDFIKNVLGDSVTIDLDRQLELRDFAFDRRWKDRLDEPDEFTLTAGDHAMSAKQAMRYILSDSNQEWVPGINHQLPERKNHVIKAGLHRLGALLTSNLIDTTKTGASLISFLQEKLSKGQVATDYDFLGNKGILPALLAQLGKTKLKGIKITMPEVESGGGLQINDQLFGDGGTMRVNRLVNEHNQPTQDYYKLAHPSVQKLVDQTIQVMNQLDKEGISYDDPDKGLPARGVLPLWGQVPILGDINATNLAKDYYGSVRKLVKDKLFKPQQIAA